MSGPLGSSQWMYSSGDAAATSYDIDNSLRINDDDSAYLSRTPTTAGNQKTWTFSCWVKRGNLGNNPVLFESHSDGSNFSRVYINGDYFRHYDITSGADYGHKSSMILRDSSAWYHFVLVIDTTEADATDRAKLYVNGKQDTTFTQASGALPLNHPTRINNTDTHYVGQNGGSGQYLDGYISEVNFIDGATKEPTDFGEFDATYGHWKPIAYAGTYGTNGFYLPMRDTSLVSASALEPDGTTVIAPGTDGKYKYHIFTEVGDSTFTVDSASTGNLVEYLVIAGGGGGGGYLGGGGGGAGGYRTGYAAISTTGGNGSGVYTVTVGDGGDGILATTYVSTLNSGSDSSFNGITSAGGGGGSGGSVAGGAGGSGGGGGAGYASGGGGATPSGQGNNGTAGGLSSSYLGGGGGGASSIAGTFSSNNAGDGGSGTTSSITGSNVTRAGGGGGGNEGTAGGGSAGSATGGGGAGGLVAGTPASGTPNTGGGGGGTGYKAGGIISGAGGSGVVIIRYKYQG